MRFYAHTAYYPYLKDILDSPKVRGLAHITGDGICATWNGFYRRIKRAGRSENNRVLPLFKVIKRSGRSAGRGHD